MTTITARTTVLEALVPGFEAAPVRSLGARLMAWLQAAHDRRRVIGDYQRLLEIGEPALRDIGISRTDVQAALLAARQR